MIQDTPEGTTHYYNDGCGIKEHNMTLRRAWEGYCRQFGIGSVNEVDAWDFFMTQFDEMLAEDIEKMKERIKSNHLGISFDYGVEECIDYLEARRLSIKE
jgi:hypothetical protein